MPYFKPTFLEGMPIQFGKFCDRLLDVIALCACDRLYIERVACNVTGKITLLCLAPRVHNSLRADSLKRAAAGSGTNAMMSRENGVPACEGSVAFGRGDYDASHSVVDAASCQR